MGGIKRPELRDMPMDWKNCRVEARASKFLEGKAIKSKGGSTCLDKDIGLIKP